MKNLIVSLLFILPRLIDGVTVGGISAGCFMAVQTHFAFSSLINGIECTAGGPYYCAQDNLEIALTECTSGSGINVDYLENVVVNTANNGYIDSLDNLKNSRVWMLSATNDTVVYPQVVKANIDLYRRFVPRNNISFKSDIEGEHAMITNSFGNNCDYLGSPYINNCDYDSAGEALKYLYGYKSKSKEFLSNLQSFDQTQFLPYFDESIGLSKTGYIYVPKICNSFGCDIHIVFHGCNQAYENINTTFVEHSGYLPWAEANNLTVIFPQAQSNLLNPFACFDWWGYTGSDYASNIAIQMVFVSNLIDYFS